MINYAKATALQPVIRAFCYNHEAWIVGSAAKYLLDINNEPPKDWDVLIPLYNWIEASKIVPRGCVTNSHGGVKIVSDTILIDLWGGDLGWYFAQIPENEGYAVHIKSWTYLKSGRGFTNRRREK